MRSAVALAVALLAVPVPGTFREAKSAFEEALEAGDAVRITEAVKNLAGTGDARAVPILIQKALFHEALPVREAAVEGLQGMKGPKASKALARELSSGSKPEMAVVIARSLRGHGGEDVQRALRSALRHRRWEVRLETIRTIGESREEGSGDDLAKLVDDRHPRVAHEAARVLEAITGKWPDEVKKPGLGDLFPNPIPTRRLAILLEVSDAMRARAGGPDEGTILDYARERISTVMDLLPEGSRMNLFTYSSRARACFQEPSAVKRQTRKDLADFLAGLQPEYGADLWEGVRRAFQTEDLDTLYIVAAGMPVGTRTMEPEEVRRQIRLANYSRAVTIHTVHLPTRSEGTEAARSLLEGIAADAGGTLRIAPISAPGEKKEGEEPPSKEEGAKPEDESKRGGGFVVRKEKGRITTEEWRRVLGAFEEAIEKGEGAPAASIVEGFAAADDKRAVEVTVRKALFHDELDLAEAAERGLARCRDPEAISALVRSSRNVGDPERRVVLIRLLAGMGGEKVDRELVRFLSEVHPWAVRSAAIVALDGRKVKSAIPPLKRIVGGENPRLAAEAAATLRSMGETVDGYEAAPVSRLFPERIDGATVAFAIDTYESMRSEIQPLPSQGEEPAGPTTRLALVSEAVVGALVRIPAGGRFNIFGFGLRVTRLGEEYAAPTVALIDRARRFVEGLKTDTGGRDTGGLIRDLLEAGRADTIFVVTDGMPDLAPGVTSAGLRKRIRGENRGRNVRIHVVLVNPEPSPETVSLLEGIALENGGALQRYP